MRLAVVTHDVVKGRGQGRVNYEVVRRALEQGIEVTLVSRRVAGDLAGHPRIRWVRLATRHLPTQLLFDLWFGVRAARWLRGHAGRHDVVMMNGASAWEPSDVNIVHFVHGAWLRSPYHASRVSRGPRSWYQWVYSRVHAGLERRALARARVVVAVSEQVREELRAIGVPADRVRVILNGVDGEEFRPAPVERGPLGLPAGVPLALFVGDIRSPRKNLELVLHALPRVPELHLAVAAELGRTPYPALARRLGVEPRVHFLGFRTDVPRLMQAADLFVFPSRYEANALVLLEALASGLPVIATRTGGAGMLVTADCGVLLEDPADGAAMARALERLLSRAERDRMRAAARGRALAHSWSRMTDGYLALCDELAAERLPGALPGPAAGRGR